MASSDHSSQTLAICFGQFGPYHHARVAALQRAGREHGASSMEHRAKVIPVQIADATSTYAWKEGNESKVNGKRCNDLRTLCEGIEETASSVEVFFRARNLFKHEGVGVVFVPSYSPARYFALFAAAKSLGLRTVMMNESHAGTEKAAGCKKWIKRQIVKQFDAAFVGGAPHKRHFSALGIPEGKIFTGYDAVDNGFFSARADEALRMEHDAKHLSTLNSQHSTKQGPRSACGLPERYFLNLGRMVPKKNLSTLVEAYARFARASVEVKGGGLKVEGTGAAASPPQGEGSDVVGSNRSLATRHLVPALVFVGSGELECELEAQARSLGLEVVDRRGWKSGNPGGEERSSLNQEDRGAIFFYGFRQLDENPIFYALAEAFVLPSLYEEWGLVVNEAMACSLPVIVSRTAGCAEDLLPGSGPVAENCKLNTENSFEPRSNGFLFDPTSVEALAEALRRIVEMGDGRWEMGKQSRKIVANFGCENFARQVLAAAEAASGGKGSGC